MEFHSPVTELIRVRSSWRSYDTRQIPEDLKALLEEALTSSPKGPFGNEVRLSLLERLYQQDDKPRKLGTYGVIKGAQNYLAGVVTDGEQALEDYGYVFEWLVLHATGLGLATCWMGGTFHRDSFGKALQIGSGEVVPAVSPVGYARGKRSVVDSVFRWVAASKKRKPWSELFFDRTFDSPLSSGGGGEYSDALEMVRLGPSASNKQPWRVVHDDSGFHFYIQRTKGYQRHFATDLQRIDMGIGMCHFELSAAERGLSGEWRMAPPDLTPPDRTSYLVSWIV